jgi:hypothetical protein
MASGIRNPMMINGVPLAVAEIDLATAEQLRMVPSAAARADRRLRANEPEPEG